MTARGRRAIATAIAAVALTATASACSAGSPPPAPGSGTSEAAASEAAASEAVASEAAASKAAARLAAALPTITAAPGAANPLGSLTSYQIIDLAFANTEAALNVQITGSITRIGETTRLTSLTLVNAGQGCVGDIFQYGIGTFQLLSDGSTAWVLPGPDYWADAATAYAAELPSLEGRYVRVTPGAGGLGMVTSLCSLTTLVGSGPSPLRKTGLALPAPATVAGVAALKITDTADGGYAVVSNSRTPMLLRFYVPNDGDGSSLTLSYSGIPVTVSAPPDNEVVDGEQYDL